MDRSAASSTGGASYAHPSPYQICCKLLKDLSEIDSMAEADFYISSITQLAFNFNLLRKKEKTDLIAVLFSSDERTDTIPLLIENLALYAETEGSRSATNVLWTLCSGALKSLKSSKKIDMLCQSIIKLIDFIKKGVFEDEGSLHFLCRVDKLLQYRLAGLKEAVLDLFILEPEAYKDLEDCMKNPLATAETTPHLCALWGTLQELRPLIGQCQNLLKALNQKEAFPILNETEEILSKASDELKFVFTKFLARQKGHRFLIGSRLWPHASDLIYPELTRAYVASTIMVEFDITIRNATFLVSDSYLHDFGLYLNGDRKKKETFSKLFKSNKILAGVLHIARISPEFPEAICAFKRAVVTAPGPADTHAAEIVA